MFRNMLLAGLAAAALMPSLVHAQSEGQARCQDQKHDNRVAGTIIGAGLGALLGNAIGEHGGKVGGTIIGGVGGAVAGNVVGGATVNCGSNQYGYYDDNGRWVPNTATAYGFYDANGQWVDTSNQGAQGYAPQPSGGYGQQGAYQPPGGYQQQQGGYQQQGAYDQQNGYAPPPPPPQPYGQAAYENRDYWAGAPLDTRERESWLERRIQQRMANGALDQWRGRHALRQLRDIQRMDSDYRSYDGHLNEDQRRDIFARLDHVRDGIRSNQGRPDTSRTY